MRYYKYALSVVLLISAIFLCGDVFGGQEDVYLKKYFENAIFLYESSKYKEAILLFEKIIEAEKTEGKFYFTPFSEIYIDKARDKDVTLMPRDGSLAERVRMQNDKENIEQNPDKIVDYYKSKRKTTSFTAKPENIKDKNVEIEESPASEEKTAVKIPEPEPEKEKEVVANADKIRRDLINEKLEEGLENLDQDTLESYENERFVDIVKRIKQYKKGKKPKEAKKSNLEW